MSRPRFMITAILFAILFGAAVLLGGCSDYKPCEVLARRLCAECPHVADHWQAACLCIENQSQKEKGFKCVEPFYEDEIRCNATLEAWDAKTCDQLN